MARKVTKEDILQFNLLYYRYHNYAEVARQTGWSAGTVSRYVDKNFIPVAAEDVKHFYIADIPEFSAEIFIGVEDFGRLCKYSDEEKLEIEELKKEISI